MICIGMRAKRAFRRVEMQPYNEHRIRKNSRLRTCCSVQLQHEKFLLSRLKRKCWALLAVFGDVRHMQPPKEESSHCDDARLIYHNGAALWVETM